MLPRDPEGNLWPQELADERLQEISATVKDEFRAKNEAMGCNIVNDYVVSSFVRRPNPETFPAPRRVLRSQVEYDASDVKAETKKRWAEFCSQPQPLI